MATTRFVYPIYNYRKKMLQIQREDEDGYCWPLGMQGLPDYLSEQGLDIKNVEWRVAVHPKPHPLRIGLTSSIISKSNSTTHETKDFIDIGFTGLLFRKPKIQF